MKKIFLIAFLLLAVSMAATAQKNLPPVNPVMAEFLSTNPPPKGFATRLDYIKSFTSYGEIDKAYRSGIITKGEAVLAMELDKVGPNDKSPMDTYGQVIDQDGQPVVGAKVRGWLGFEHGEDEEHDTKTDAQGRFQFLGLRGKDFSAIPEKEGYEFNREYRFIVNAKRPDFYIPDPKTPLIFRMWKLRGGEPMSLVRIDSFVKWGENFKHFDPYTSLIDRAGMPHPHGTDSDPLGTDGELMVKATRGIEFTNRGVREFPWAVTLQIRDGGLRPILNEPYPYVAPTNGYESSVTVTGPTNVVANGNELRHGFYFKSLALPRFGGQRWGDA